MIWRFNYDLKLIFSLGRNRWLMGRLGRFSFLFWWLNGGLNNVFLSEDLFPWPILTCSCWTSLRFLFERNSGHFFFRCLLCQQILIASIREHFSILESLGLVSACKLLNVLLRCLRDLGNLWWVYVRWQVDIHFICPKFESSILVIADPLRLASLMIYWNLIPRENPLVQHWLFWQLGFVKQDSFTWNLRWIWKLITWPIHTLGLGIALAVRLLGSFRRNFNCIVFFSSSRDLFNLLSNCAGSMGLWRSLLFPSFFFSFLFSHDFPLLVKVG